MMLVKPLRSIAVIISCLFFITSCAPEEDDVVFTPEEVVGTYSCAEKSEIYNQSNYEVKVTKSTSGSDQIVIENFYQLGMGTFVKVNIIGSDLVVPQQVVNDIKISGDGIIVNENRMNLNYTADDGGGVVDVVSGGLSK
ncbi:MAG: hypothetical protein M3Q58_03955 [Bacteroidota bacterium]|nr:hypothetical protein [Bacteroidota bacterium]